MKNSNFERSQQLSEAIVALDLARARAEEKGYDAVIAFCKAQTKDLMGRYHALGVDIGTDPEAHVPSQAKIEAGRRRGAASAGKPRRGTRMKPW